MFGIGIGPTGDELAQHGSLESSAGFATNLGEKDLTASSDFMRGILSGDASKVTSLLSPQISAVKTSAQQNTKTMAENGTRGGGTGAATAKANDTAHSDIVNLIASITGTAASSLGSTGSGLLSAGMAGNEAGFNQAGDIHAEKMAQFNDLMSGIGKTAGAIAAMPGMPKGLSQGLNAGASIF